MKNIVCPINQIKLKDNSTANKFFLNKQNTAFTLAEVLITLAIIGVVAAMTIPALMQNTQNQQYKTAYKKAFAELSQALITASMNNELVATSTSGYQAEKTTNYLAVKSHFNIVKDCDNPSLSNCWASGEQFDGRPDDSTDTGFIDNSGNSWIGLKNQDYILVDTNGKAGPNTYGKDRFAFRLENGLTATSGIPNKVYIFDDLPKGHSYCKSGGVDGINCYYKSWITGAK